MSIEHDVRVEEATGRSVAQAGFEVVERKGLGHPDTICDAVMERVSRALSEAYLEHAGAILHHNCDKALLVAGRAEHRFGGGRIREPMRLVMGDRASLSPRHLDVGAVAIAGARLWLREHLRHVDPDEHVRFQVELRPGSDELVGLFGPEGRVRGANDTSAAVGFAPLSETEQIVLAAEQHLNSGDFKARYPETGEDVKVMGVRVGEKLDLTVAMPLLDRYIETEADYIGRKEAAQRDLLEHLRGKLHGLGELRVHLNLLDHPGAGIHGLYLSVLGTSAEDADSGQVGRGNRVNGLITPGRPSSMEAAAGKNPVSHVGKIYNVLAHLLARRLHEEVPGVQEATVWLVSRIGEPVDRPRLVAACVRPAPGAGLPDLAPAVRRLVAQQLEVMPAFCRELAQGRYSVC